MKYHFKRISTNGKTGPIPVTMSAKQTCPDACPLKASGCYAESGNVNIHWQRLSDGRYDDNKNVGDLEWLALQIKALPKGQLWRMNAAGDLAHNEQSIDATALKQLTAANQGKKGFTYTHHLVEGKSAAAKHNRLKIKQANKSGFTVNLSANSPSHADTLLGLNIGPVVTIVDEWKPGDCRIQSTPAGRPIVICPAVTIDGMTCAKCKLCANPDRRSIIGFPVHGGSKKKARTIMLKAI